MHHARSCADGAVAVAIARSSDISLRVFSIARADPIESTENFCSFAFTASTPPPISGAAMYPIGLRNGVRTCLAPGVTELPTKDGQWYLLSD